MPFRDIVDTLLQSDASSFADVNDSIYEKYLSIRGHKNKRWGIKRPAMIASLQKILDVYPNAMIVHVFRDGRDVYLSYKKVHEYGFRWGPSGVFRTGLYWVDGLRRVESIRRVLPHQLYELQYEALVSDSESEMQRVCSFLGINYDVSLISGDDQDRNKNIITNEHRLTVHKKIFKPIDRKNIYKYKREMTATQLFLFELAAAPYLRKYGYELIFPVLANKLFRPVYLILYLAARAFNNVRYARLDRIQYRRALRRLLDAGYMHAEKKNPAS